MPYVMRALSDTVTRAAKAFPVVVLTGPRRAGKTTLLRKLFPSASYALLEDPDVVAAARADPRGFLDRLSLPAIIDEIQNVPELLNYIRTRVDEKPTRKGRWLLTGSQDFALMRGVSESMAGRAAILQLLPLSTQESSKVTMFRGGFPEVLAQPRAAALWFQSYLQTYLERDVRQLSQIRDLPTFRRFLSLLASRSGQILNKTDLAAPLGLSVPTMTEWLNILETTGQILTVQPYFENFGKRLIKSPKVYFADSGLACHLLGLQTTQELKRSSFAGSIFEGFVASEIVKQQINAGQARALYYFRDQRGLEVDFVVPSSADHLTFIEAKSSQTVYPKNAANMLRLIENMGNRKVQCLVVHEGKATDELVALAPDSKSTGIAGLLGALRKRG
jgi:predicted AAA+ superfamily ATPase